MKYKYKLYYLIFLSVLISSRLFSIDHKLENHSNQPPIYYPIIFGLSGGAIGLLSGGLVGSAFSGDDWGAIPSIIIGASVGECFGLSAGVYMGNNKNGNFIIDFVTSVLVLGTVSLANSVLKKPGKEDYILLTIPIFQLTGTVFMERYIGNRKSRE